MNALTNSHPCGYELRFEPLPGRGRAYAFACDRDGRVDLDAMTNHARNDYLFARSLIGRDVARPRVQRAC